MNHDTVNLRERDASDLFNDRSTPVPGRTCPLNYRYSPDVFRYASAAPALENLDVLYVVGGLYGNSFALDEVVRMFESESGVKALVFNGDFHWFDKDPHRFEAIHETVSRYVVLRGNVETELASVTQTSDAGCGCGYPEWVADETVERSNRILQTLRLATTPDQRRHMASLPMWAVATIGQARIGIVHGDAESLAGWGFAQEILASPSHIDIVRSWFVQAQVDLFACSHTCLPVLAQIQSNTAQGVKEHWIANNGAAGMPNVRHHACGLLTRIATHAPRSGTSLAGIRTTGLYVDAICVDYSAQSFEQTFLDMWPPGTDACLSYLPRIRHGTDYGLEQVVRRACSLTSPR